MGKVKKPALEQPASNKQRSIASFFTATDKTKKKDQSPLFSSVNQAKNKDKLKLKITAPKEGLGRIRQGGVIAGANAKSSSLITNSNGQDVDNTSSHAAKKIEQQSMNNSEDVMVVQETQMDDYNDDVIPDTPEVDKSLSKRKIQGRSFLAQASHLSAKSLLQPNVKSKQIKRKQVTRNLEDALKVVNPAELEKANLVTLQATGLGSVITDLRGDVASSKRLSSGRTGESPKCKRLDRRPSGGDGRSQCKTRLRYDKGNSKQTESRLSGLKGTELAEKLKLNSSSSKVKNDKVTRLAIDLNEDSSDSVLDEILEDLQQVSENIATSQKRNPFSSAKKSNFSKQKNARPEIGDGVSKLKQKRNIVNEIISNESSLETSIEASSLDKDVVLNEILQEIDCVSLTGKKPWSANQLNSATNNKGGLVAKDGCKMEITSRRTSTTAAKYGATSDMYTKPDQMTIQNDTTPKDKGKAFGVKQKSVPTNDVTPMKNTEDGKTFNASEFVDDMFWEMSPFKTEKGVAAACVPPINAFGRHTVKYVHQESMHADKILELESVPDGLSRVCELQGFWTDTRVKEGDTVNIIGDFDDQNHIVIDDGNNLIVVNPDLLISGTSVVSTVFCLRKTVLNEKFKGYEGGNIHMLLGSILHCVFQQAVKEGKQTFNDLRSLSLELLRDKSFLHDMYAQGLEEKDLIEKILTYIPHIQKWMQTYMPSKKVNVKAKPGNEPTIEVNTIADIEENIWSPRYGIKGKIDLTVDVKIHKKTGVQNKIVPLELKTGRASYSVEHQGQVTLYCMMSGDRRSDPEEGLLCYLKEGSMKSILADHAKRRGLLQLRNELAHYLSTNVHEEKNGDQKTYSSTNLPQPIDNERFCGKCPHLMNCALYQRSIENYKPPPGHIMETIVPEALSHLSQSHLEYFKHWCLLLHMEIESSRKSMKDIWCKTAQDRERKGECFSELVLSPRINCVPNFDGQLHVFKRALHSQFGSLTSVGLVKTDSIIVSTSNTNCISLAMGTIVDVSDSSLTVFIDRDLYLSPDWESCIFRLDKAEYLSSMLGNFTQLSRLMENNDNSTRLRKLIIDRTLPTFDKTMSKTAVAKVKDIFKPLNKPQKTAILRALLAKDYVLIKGFPGAGKTSTIVALIQVLIAMGQSILLTSYTHSAVDNILLKLVKHTTNFIRLGRVSRIHLDILPYSSERLTNDVKTLDDLKELYSSKAVVATTCLGTNHAVFSQRTFDVCIVDEATQVMQPTCLGPLFQAKKHVLVGDPLQLPPVVQNKEASSLGMSESLFMRLDDTGATYELDLQYRMNSDIMRICNEMTYGGDLKCGSSEVASATLDIKNVVGQPAWITHCLSTELNHSVVFLDTHEMNVSEERDQQKLVKNVHEAGLVAQLTQQFIEAGVAVGDIGVISPYRNQVKVIKTSLASCCLEGIEVNTVDTYQGRDKSVIIISFVRTAKDSEIKPTEILQDWRRLNVAVTRAKHKLILIGCGPSLRRYKPLEKMFTILQTHQIIHLTNESTDCMT